MSGPSHLSLKIEEAYRKPALLVVVDDDDHDVSPLGCLLDCWLAWLALDI